MIINAQAQQGAGHLGAVVAEPFAADDQGPLVTVQATHKVSEAVIVIAETGQNPGNVFTLFPLGLAVDARACR